MTDKVLEAVYRKTRQVGKARLNMLVAAAAANVVESARGCGVSTEEAMARIKSGGNSEPEPGPGELFDGNIN
jgi:hypothetical protein